MKGFPFFKPLLPALVLLGVGCGGDSTDDHTPAGDQLALSSVTIGGQSGLSDFDDVSPDAEIVLDFTAALDAAAGAPTATENNQKHSPSERMGCVFL